LIILDCAAWFIAIIIFNLRFVVKNGVFENAMFFIASNSGQKAKPISK